VPDALDVMMPDLDGWSVLAALRQDAELAEIPVIMVTIVDEHRRGIALGAAGYLTKPIDGERLHRLVGRFRAPTPPTRVLLVEDAKRRLQLGATSSIPSRSSSSVLSQPFGAFSRTPSDAWSWRRQHDNAPVAP